ncbi:MAG: hypothetical protein ABMA64_33645 [Myxococcota bacterium]
MGTRRDADRELDLELEDPPEAGTPEPAYTPSPARRAPERPAGGGAAEPSRPPPDEAPPVEDGGSEADPPGEGFQWVVVEDRRPGKVDDEEDAPTYGFSPEPTPERPRHTSTPPSVSRSRATPDGPPSVPQPPPPPPPVLLPPRQPVARDERPVPSREALRSGNERRVEVRRPGVGRSLLKVGLALGVLAIGCTGALAAGGVGLWYLTRQAPPPPPEVVAPAEPEVPEEFDGIRVEKGLRKSPTAPPSPRTPPE